MERLHQGTGSGAGTRTPLMLKLLDLGMDPALLDDPSDARPIP